MLLNRHYVRTLAHTPRYAATFIVSCLLHAIPLTAAAQNAPGGFIEQPSTASPRVPLSNHQLENMLPQRGKFTFPAPYHTTGIRLTNSSDCKKKEDCVMPAGYAYWNNINNHVGSDNMLIFVGFDKRKGGDGPSLLQYNKRTDVVRNLGPLFEDKSPLSWATGEGWYFSATQPNALYVNDGPSLYRYDVITRKPTLVFDIRAELGSGHYLWQSHSSADDLRHSVTVRRDGSYAMIGCGVYDEGTKRFSYFPAKGQFDECQIDKSGKWLVIKEDLDGINGEDNRIINLDTLQERILWDSDGAAGHSDLGYGYMIAADNFAGEANTQKLWNLGADSLTGKSVYHNADWSVSTLAHVSHGNAKPGIPAEQQYACGSSANRRNSAEANEIVCFGLDGSEKALVVAPVMTDLDASGGGSDYFKSPKGNLDTTGEYFIWTSNTGGGRLDYFLVKVPVHLLGGSVATASSADTTTRTSNALMIGTRDVVAPVQSNISVDNISTSGARITWSSNEPAEDMVQYGTTQARGSDTPINGSFALTHTQTLSNLRPGTRYHYRVLTRDASGNIAMSQNATFTTRMATPRLVSVAWANLTNIAATGSTLSKQGGCDGCDDAGALSSQAASNGPTFLEFKVDDSSNLAYIGLADSGRATRIAGIDYAIRIQSGYAEVRENGVYRGEVRVAPGDVLRISIVNGNLTYSHNYQVFYSSSVTPSWPLRVHARFLSQGSAIMGARLLAVLD